MSPRRTSVLVIVAVLLAVGMVVLHLTGVIGSGGH
jgi:hypothetical protein